MLDMKFENDPRTKFILFNVTDKKAKAGCLHLLHNLINLITSTTCIRGSMGNI